MVGEDQETWGDSEACRTADPDELFVEGAAQNRAKVVCTGCPVRTECPAYALNHRIEHGIWNGMPQRERRALLRRRPLVTSWSRLLEAARSEHQRTVLRRRAALARHGVIRRPHEPFGTRVADGRRTESARAAVSVSADRMHGWRSTVRYAIP
ncbi:WhiB family transcriptional regulator [Streptomyces sp. NPDC059447]|uniref:WhiB family transcriptional regulator n=1 Tax=Streptomyces sp. NPDC059447 TaxID=3346834 RepID=UPI003691FE2B